MPAGRLGHGVMGWPEWGVGTGAGEGLALLSLVDIFGQIIFHFSFHFTLPFSRSEVGYSATSQVRKPGSKTVVCAGA